MENVEGRVVLDILRHVLTACNLSSFSLVDCCQSLLGRRLEVLPASAATSLSKGTAGSERHAFHPPNFLFEIIQAAEVCVALQLSAYLALRTDAARCVAVHGPAVAGSQMRHLACLQA